MRAGQLNRLISIRSPISTARSTDGEPIISWSTVLADVWADVQPISGRELFTMDSRWSEVTNRIILRWSTIATAINPKCIVVDSAGVQYDIKSVIDMNDQRRSLELLVSRID